MLRVDRAEARLGLSRHDAEALNGLLRQLRLSADAFFAADGPPSHATARFGVPVARVTLQLGSAPPTLGLSSVAIVLPPRARGGASKRQVLESVLVLAAGALARRHGAQHLFVPARGLLGDAALRREGWTAEEDEADEADAFPPLCLDRARFPRAAAMDTRAAAEREYADDLVRAWLGTPAKVEGEFQASCGRADVPPDYLAQLEARLRQVHGLCGATFAAEDAACEQEWSLRAAVLNLVVAAAAPPRALTLKVIVIRPCAEGFGLFRVVLNELARIAAHWGADLVLHDCMPAMDATASRTWPALERATVYDEGLGRGKLMLRVPQRLLAGPRP